MTIKISEQPDSVTAKLEGRLDTLASTQVAGDMAKLNELASKQITLDCSAMEFISSSGLRLFLSLRKAADAKGGNVMISGANDDVKEVFKITGFSTLFKFI